MIAHPLARAAFLLFGLAMTALGAAMFIENDLEQPGDKLFAGATLMIGVLNLSAGFTSHRVRRLGLVTAVLDVLYLAIVLYLLRNLSIG